MSRHDLSLPALSALVEPVVTWQEDAEVVRERRKKALWVLDETGMAKSGYAPRKSQLAEWVVELADEIARLTAALETEKHLHDLDHKLADQWQQRAIDAETQADAQGELAEAAEQRVEELEAALRPIVKEFDLWAAGADDGEFVLWDLPRLCEAIVSARAALGEKSPFPKPKMEEIR